MSQVANWMAFSADPLGSRRRPPWRRPRAEMVDALVTQAELHGVLGAVVQNFFPHMNAASSAVAHEAARHRQRGNAMFSLMLTREADTLMNELRDAPVTVVKGPTFARAIYPRASLRTFSDVDLLVAPEALSRVGALLQDKGFQLAEINPPEDPREWKWLHAANPSIMVEVQTDLVHAESLRKVISLPYEVIASAPQSPAALLLVALIHGVAHHYDKLQHVVDICQAARALTDTAEEQRFGEMVKASNARFAAVVGLGLAGRLFSEPRCRELARAIGSVKYSGLSRILLGKSLILSMTDDSRDWHQWRQKAFRWLLKRGEQRIH